MRSTHCKLLLTPSLEQELNKLALDEQGRQMTKEISALLATDDLISMALKSRQDLVDEFEFDQAAQAPKTYNSVPGLVEVLFCLLPALSAARRDHCSRLTRDKTYISRTNVPTLNSPTTAVSMPLDSHQATHEDENEEASESSKLRLSFWPSVTSLRRKGAKIQKICPGVRKGKDRVTSLFSPAKERKVHGSQIHKTL